MARLQSLVANLLCHEAVSFLIYGAIFLLLLFYIPYWMRQQIDRRYLKFLAKRAREKYLQQRMELCQKSPEVECIDSGMLNNEDDEEVDKRMDIEPTPVNILERDSDEKLSLITPHVSRQIH